MIPKNEILELSSYYALQPTTIQKDYVIGWILRAISNHPNLSRWAFKGGTCLKKCYFETYRFSEDLDFTVPSDQAINNELIKKYLEEAISWIEGNSGIIFPRKDWKIEEYENPRGNTSFQAKISYNGPIGGPINSLPRVKFDITQDELLVDDPRLRNLHHGFSDAFNPSPEILCYSINEILAEKSRALFERNGRARDVYDVINISRNFRKEIEPLRAKDIANAKFKFKGLSAPTVQQIMSAIDQGVLRANWEMQLSHQISNLPPIESFLADLEDAIAWWLEPKNARPNLEPMPQVSGQIGPRIFFPTIGYRTTSSLAIELIRRAAHNRQCALISYHGSMRLVEPYSLRYPSTGNEVLHAWELEKNGMPSNKHKIFITNEIDSATISEKIFNPKWAIEL
ncbi:MAG: nucleotidyl transferase AbiEii/AbiGii toxin family protein [Patescibacteria group bacterium]